MTAAYRKRAQFLGTKTYVDAISGYVDRTDSNIQPQINSGKFSIGHNILVIQALLVTHVCTGTKIAFVRLI